MVARYVMSSKTGCSRAVNTVTRLDLPGLVVGWAVTTPNTSK